MVQSELDFEDVGRKPMIRSEEHEYLPLKKRQNVLSARSRLEVKVETDVPVSPTFNGRDIVAEEKNRKVVDSKNLQCVCASEDHRMNSTLREERHVGELVEVNKQENLDLVTFKVECAGDNPSANSGNASFIAGIQSANFDAETNDKFLDELDHVVLNERLKKLLSSKCLGSSSALPKDNAGTGKRKLEFGDQKPALPNNRICKISKSLNPCSLKDILSPTHKNAQMMQNDPKGNRSSCTNELGTRGNDEKKIHMSCDIGNEQNSTVLKLLDVKAEPPSCDEFQNPTATLASKISGNPFIVKTEIEIVDVSYDELDHMLLSHRMKLMSSKVDLNPNIKGSSDREGKKVSSDAGSRPFTSEPIQLLKINRPRKKRKTATDSVETAMEEDAPGLLQVLIEKGVVVSEIKLYGEPESNDALDDASSEDNFGELETVISKLFSRRESLLNLGHFRCSKEEKPSYCLECLFSLVEQARYLQFRHWPVEWGWCRDLQSFIFVFERHNRIVLERPEYGYATYFFELADSLSIDWQIKRLVVAMKFTNCSRITLLENKPLVVGNDLTEGDARVLMEYGWAPNTGLGTMLNYCDRVVHDRKNEKDRSEWRSKIGKLLVDGYNGGTLTPLDIPIKAAEYNAANPQVKIELTEG